MSDVFAYEAYLRVLESDGTVAQAYETLLSSLHLLHQARPLQTVLITSTQPREGKTTVTVNLAMTLALAGKRALVVDADLRKPRVHSLFGLDNARGLTDVLTGRLGIHDVLETVPLSAAGGAADPSVSVITSGHASRLPFNTIASAKLEEMFQELSAYDVVLLDSPPLLSVGDALALARLVDGVVLVLNTGVATEREVRDACDRLNGVGAHLLGVVLNRFVESRHGPAHHPYHGYYGREVQGEA